ncbi:hypothetical protein [Shewanella acanthi]|uniref:hypothetical protein n=1 Tax=Shewanella acanthi TaxID=2864212 RepID=UPI001C6555B5|nr:hypothetical protein [Shewanella acanthi]QYJ78356.1 hypothetical protein K0H61_14800 [Shewanella acanthi]
MNREIAKRIQIAFNNDEYEWRTINGVAKESNVSNELVQMYIAENGSEIVKSSARNEKGESLYTSRNNYRNRSISERLSSIIRNRGA